MIWTKRGALIATCFAPTIDVEDGCAFSPGSGDEYGTKRVEGYAFLLEALIATCFAPTIDVEDRYPFFPGGGDEYGTKRVHKMQTLLLGSIRLNLDLLLISIAMVL